MSDKILSCTEVKDGTTTVQYDVSYEVTNNGNMNQFCVVVLASELTNPADTDEVKTKANAKAKTIKDVWVADLPAYVETPVETVVGNVTLS